MSSDDPLAVLAYLAIAAVAGYLWWSDYQAQRAGKDLPKSPMPGASPTTWAAVSIGVVGSLLLVGVETGGEYALGVSGEQNVYPAIVLLAWLAAGFVEEFIFRGFLVVRSKGRGWLIGSATAFSLIFALIHFHWWDVPEEASWSDGTLQLDAKALWSTGILFVNSLWWYAVRFLPGNPQRSLIPCFAAHAASNAAVFFVKLSQGHIQGLY